MIFHPELMLRKTFYLFLQVGQFAPAENNSHHVLFKVCIRWYLFIKMKKSAKH